MFFDLFDCWAGASRLRITAYQGDTAYQGEERSVPKVHRKCPKSVPEVSRKCTKSVPKVCQKCPKSVPKVSEKCTKNGPKVSSGLAGLGWAGLAGLGWAALGWAGLGWAALAGLESQIIPMQRSFSSWVTRKSHFEFFVLGSEKKPF